MLIFLVAMVALYVTWTDGLLVVYHALVPLYFEIAGHLHWSPDNDIHKSIGSIGNVHVKCPALYFLTFSPEPLHFSHGHSQGSGWNNRFQK